MSNSIPYVASGRYSFRSEASKGSPSGYWKRVCVRHPQKTPNVRWGFRKRRLTNSPRRQRLVDGQLSSLCAPRSGFSSCGVASVIMCCSAHPASSSAPLRPCCYPRVGLVANIILILYSWDVDRFFIGKSMGSRIWRLLKNIWVSTL